MIYSRIQFWILLFVVSCSLTFAQEEKPKVALVLSGGGAKGIAHIPLLQKLDSLGIVPDLVVGTSMGSAVGGLYAIGYSGDSIASIATNANWENILRGELSLDAVRNEEKSEFGRYAVSFDLVDGKPKLKNALLKDQELREFLTSLVYPVYEYNHFDEFYIPFRAVATDLVEGKEVVLEDGSLSTAIRASISIPGVFEPVKYEGTLLVDGGVVNNFPTDVAKRLGADIIIGSDVGEGMLPIEKLDNLPAVLFQTSMLTSGLKVEDNRKLCRVLVNHSDSLTYSTQDFVKAQGIYDQGKIATNANLDALVELANYLKTFKASPLRKKVVLSDIVVDGVKFKGISKGNQRFIEALINIEPQKPYSVEDLKRKIDRAMGTEIFDQITFRALKEGNKTYIEFTGFEKAPHKIGGAMHYDTYQGVGVILNYTGRNIIGGSSRVLVGLDIAEQPKFRAQLQKNIGVKRAFWTNVQVFGQNLNQRFFSQGTNGEVLNTRYWQSSAQINRNINPFNDYVGLDLAVFASNAKPNIDPGTSNNVYDLKKALFQSFEISAYYKRNTLNRVFFPTSGSFIQARVSRSISSYANIQFQDASEFSSNGDTNGFFKLNLDAEKRFKIKNDALVIRATAGFMLEDNLKGNDLNIYQYGQIGFYELGGIAKTNKRYAYSFNGLSEGDVLSSQFMRLYLGYQLNPLRNFYATPYVNAAVVGFDDANDFFENFTDSRPNWQNAVETSNMFSAGATLSYKSIFGPVNLDVAYINGIQQLILFFNVGMTFNIQN